LKSSKIKDFWELALCASIFEHDRKYVVFIDSYENRKDNAKGGEIKWIF